MDVLVPVVNAAVVTAAGFALWWATRGRFDALERRMDRMEARIDDRIDRLEVRVDDRIDRLEVRLDAMRSDLTAVALAVGAKPRAGN